MHHPAHLGLGHSMLLQLQQGGKAKHAERGREVLSKKKKRTGERRRNGLGLGMGQSKVEREKKEVR